ncbi:DinB family protein [uncultured Croceitalea sp.]|uniref:DinB family protein n=1 Tax=uncultured Croceitalea sp. TaxID=1798908 RepID=UPI003305E11A
MKSVVSLLFCLYIFSGLNAQTKTPKTDFTKMYLPVWLEAKEHCLAVAEAMPEDLYSYRPTPKSKSFAEQMVHIGYTVELLTQRYVEGMTVKPNAPDASVMAKEEIIALVRQGFDYTTEVIMNIEQPRLDETCVMYHSGNTVSRAFAFFYVQDHMTNHRAKANLYLRMNDIAPPEYTW